VNTKKIQIGKHIFKNNAFLAPMAGITDHSFRTLAARFGAGLVVSEMIASASLGAGQQEMIRRLKKIPNMPHVVQLSGNQSHWLELGAKMAADAGADIIDINMGCPSKKVTNGVAGAALMRVPDKALKLIETIVNATDLPVTLKMRLGWDEENINAPQIAVSAVNAGVQMLTVHGRTRQQFYKGKARWQPVRDVVEAVNVPVVVNGDIVDFSSAKSALKISGADAVMIGRACYGATWIVGEIGKSLAGETISIAPTGRDLLALMIEHYELMMQEYGADHGVRVARKHLGWYLEKASIKPNKQLKKLLLTSHDTAEVKTILQEIFATQKTRTA